MAKALTTSEAVAQLFTQGFKNRVNNYVEDNEFTEPFGKSFGTDLENRVAYSVIIEEDADGHSVISLYHMVNRNGYRIFRYSKATAAQKKRFLEVIKLKNMN